MASVECGRILLLSKSDLSRDPRIIRQVHALSEDYAITAVGYIGTGIEGVRDEPAFRPISGGSFTGKARKAVGIVNRLFVYNTTGRVALGTDSVVFKALRPNSYDLIIANEINTLPLAVAMQRSEKEKTPIWCDLHEYYLGNEHHGGIRRKLQLRDNQLLLKKYRADVAAWSTVSPGLVDLYKQTLGIESELITNAREYSNSSPSKVGVNGKIQLVHHGGAQPARRLELMVEMMRFVDPNRFELHFFLIGQDAAYVSRLRNLSNGLPIVFHDPLPYDRLVEATNSFDIGLFLLPPTNKNYEFALPNKLFEYVQARLAVAIGPSTDMASVVREHNLGIVADDFLPETLARCINGLSIKEIQQFKDNSHQNARQLSFEQNRSLMQRLANSLVQKQIGIK